MDAWTKTVFTLAWLSYRGSLGIAGPKLVAKRVRHMLEVKIHELKTLDDAWTVAWGPALHRPDDAVFADGMMVVVQHKRHPERLIVAIRGTNPPSLTTWLFQNFEVATQVPWPYAISATPAGARIAQGTADGLQMLLTNVPAAGLPGAGLTLLQFLQGQVQLHGALDLTLTGHSLGGVLASTLALALTDLRDLGQWDLQRQATLSTCSFAAPTAGNISFAGYTDTRIGQRLRRIWNARDAVPHAWDTVQLRQIPTLYPRFLFLPDLAVESAVSLALGAVNGNDYAHPSAGEHKFVGSFAEVPFFGAVQSFPVQAVYAHGQAYLEYMEVDNMLSLADIFSW
jgi:hypothetical protein